MTRRDDHVQLSEDADSRTPTEPREESGRPGPEEEPSAPEPPQGGTHGRPSDDSDPGHS